MLRVAYPLSAEGVSRVADSRPHPVRRSRSAPGNIGRRRSELGATVGTMSEKQFFGHITENLSRAHRVSSALKAGTVWVNCFFIRDLRTPFGGSKQSGIGREGGLHSLEFYTELRNVMVKY